MKVVRRISPFIRQFSGPGENGIVCFPFWQAVVASGCPGECAYCFLQTQRPYISGRYELKGTLFENLRDLEHEAKQWLISQREPAGLILGENQDGLAFEKPYKKLLGFTPLEILIPLFNSPVTNPVGHSLIILSKFTSTQYAEVFKAGPNVVFSWSVSLAPIAEQYEKAVSPLERRYERAHEMREKGWRIRLRLDALAPIPEWESWLDWAVHCINAVRPEMLTIGALRASNPTALRRAAENNGRDSSIFDHIKSVDPSGFKHRTDDTFHRQAFRLIKQRLMPDIALGLCKEDVSLWRDCGVEWNGCHCLHGKQDLVSLDRIRQVGL